MGQGSKQRILPAETSSAAETEAVGARLAEYLEPQAIVALYGDLGAGKTHLVRGICTGLGVPPEAVSSPTFTIVNEYEGRLPVYHFDAYRVKGPEEFFELGYEEYFYGDGICLIEWPERGEALLHDDTIRLRPLHLGEDRRRIERVDARP